MSELDRILQARLKQTEGTPTDSNPESPERIKPQLPPSKPSSIPKSSKATKTPPPKLQPLSPKPVLGDKPSKPVPPRKPQLPPKNINPKVLNKINASLKTNKPNKPPPLTAKPKVLSYKPKKAEDSIPSPGAAALASLLQNTSLKEDSKDDNGTVTTDTSNLFRSPKLSRAMKAKSIEVTKPRSVSDLTYSLERPFSTSVDDKFLNEFPRRRASPVIDCATSSLARKKRTSLSPSISVESPLASRVHSPTHTVDSSRSNSVDLEVLEDDDSRRASSVPLDTPLSPVPKESVSPIELGAPLSVQSQTLKAKSTSDLRKVNAVRRRPPPPPPSEKPPVSLQSKPESPKSSPKSPVQKYTEQFEAKSRSSSLPTENSGPVSSSTPPSSPPKTSFSPQTNKTSDPTSLKNLPPFSHPIPHPSSPTIPSNGSLVSSPPGTGVKVLSEMFSGGSPTIRVTRPTVKGPPPSLELNREAKTDSGFGSEAPDEVTLATDTSVESLPEETVTSPVSPATSPTNSDTGEVWDEAKLEKARSKRHNIAKELLSTEKTYVERIRFIAVDFHELVKDFNVKQKQAIPQSVVQQIFLNIQQIHQLNENILQELQQRMDSWETHEGLGDVIARLAPFLKLYATYTAGFEDAMKTLTDWTKRNKGFDTLIREFERNTLIPGLGVAQYMLEPVQRLPRYKLLLADYLKYLPPGSPDKPDTTKALGIISEAADHANDRIKELENSNTILAIHRSLTDYEGSLVTPSRVFVMKGELKKSSRKTETPRMFFLFSDVLLHTKPAANGTFEFKDEMPIYGMRVEVPKVALVPHSFEVHSTSRALILIANSEDQKTEWMAALNKVIQDDFRKRASLRRTDRLLETSNSNDGVEFGTIPPIMVPDKSVTMCQTCSAAFTFTFRRHHCRACGKVVCGNCSQGRAYLTYMDKTERVCDQCYVLSRGNKEKNDGQDSPTIDKVKKQDSAQSGVLNLKGLEEDAVIAAYVLSQEGRNWRKHWYQVKRDFVLYKFKAHEDIKAIYSMPLPGYSVKTNFDTGVINLIHPSSKKHCDCFKVEDPVAFENWVVVLQKVVKMELPDMTVCSPLSSQSSFDENCELSSRPTSAQNSGEDCTSPAGSRTDSFSKDPESMSGSTSPQSS